MKSHASFNLRRMIQVSVLGGLAYVLTYLAIPIIPMAPYMKLDFGDIPILLATVLLSVRSGILVAVLRSLLYFVFTGISLINLVGITALLIASVTIILVVASVEKMVHGKVKYPLMILGTATALTIIMSLLNYFVITPLYIQMAGFKLSLNLRLYVFYTVVPFNLIKGLLIGMVFAIVINRNRVWEKYKE
jgi:riboflavin transporter